MVAVLGHVGSAVPTDVRQDQLWEGFFAEHYRGHPFFACSAPLSRLELMIADLVPRRTAPVVLLDGGGDVVEGGKRLHAVGKDHPQLR